MFFLFRNLTKLSVMIQIDGYNEEDEERSLMAVGGGGPFFDMLGPTQIQYYGYWSWLQPSTLEY